MSLSHSPSIVTDGLFFYIDAANRRSYPGVGNIYQNIIDKNTGTLIGDISYSNNTFILGGTNGYIATNYNINLDNNRNYSYEIWFKDNATGLSSINNTALISNYAASLTVPYSMLHIYDAGYIIFSERNTLTESVTINNGFVNICDGSWKHIVAVASSTQLRLYINNNLINQGNRPGGSISSNQNYVIGGNHLNRYQSCEIALCRIYIDKALSPSEISQNFEAHRGRFGL